MRSMADYRTVYPDLMIELVEFFSTENTHEVRDEQGLVKMMRARSVWEFMEHLHKKQESPSSKPYPQAEPINAICRKLVDLGLMFSAGQAPGANVTGVQNTYVCSPLAGSRDFVNREISNAVYGWPCCHTALNCETDAVGAGCCN